MDISRIADLPAINQTNLTRPAGQRTEMKSSTLASEHTDSFIRSQTAYMPAYTKRSAQKQASDNNLKQKEDGEDRVRAVGGDIPEEKAERTAQGIQHIIRAMLVKQGEVLSGNVPSVGAKLYAEELLSQIRRLYGNSPADEESAEYWQPEPTAERLITFFNCVSVEGDRETLIDKAFNGAFRDTEALFGGRGRLPLESYETRALVLKRYFNV